MTTDPAALQAEIEAELAALEAQDRADAANHPDLYPELVGLYGMDALAGYSKSAPLYLCQDQRAVDAARNFGLQAVGTAGGDGTLGEQALAALNGFSVVLWPSHDQAGTAWSRATAPLLGEASSIVDNGAIWNGRGPQGQTAADLLALPFGGLPVRMAGSERRAVTVMLDTVTPEKVHFLWDPYVPLGKLSLLEGDPGLGKSTLALKLVSEVTRGGKMAGESLGPGAGKALYMVSEDGIADTIVPRLQVMGADLSKIGVLAGWKEGDEAGSLTFDDMPLIEEEIAHHQPRILVIDPIQAYLGGVDMSKAEQTRPVLFALARLAEEYNCAVLVIRHLRKSQAGTKDASIYRGLGSIDILGAARSVLAITKKDDDYTVRMKHIKCNVAMPGRDLSFTIDNTIGFKWENIGAVGCEACERLGAACYEHHSR